MEQKLFLLRQQNGMNSYTYKLLLSKTAATLRQQKIKKVYICTNLRKNVAATVAATKQLLRQQK